MKIAQTMTTLAEAEHYLINSCGVKPNWAHAAVTEFYKHDSDVKLQRYDDTVEDALAPIDVTQSEAEVFKMYYSFCTYDIVETADGFIFDGQLTFDLNGDYL
jgi:hypothetical protein